DMPASNEDATVSVSDGITLLDSSERTNYPLDLSVNDFGDSFSFTAQISNSVRAERVCEYMHIALEHLVQALEKA
ncbi:hypothetical protein, partial [Collimonas pratensis]|uniref:hypothetical protein n=1 Tax=Collimonas pratensis TaxID=279113 RepID=UPI001982644F